MARSPQTIMKTKLLFAALLLCIFALSGCTVVSANRVFPKFTWYWSRDAQIQRAENAQNKAEEKQWNAETQYELTNSPAK